MAIIVLSTTFDPLFSDISLFLDVSKMVFMVVNTLFVQFVSMERKFLKWQLPGKRFERWTGIHPADRNILYSGLGLRMARCGIASFVVVGGYLFAIDRLLPK